MNEDLKKIIQTSPIIVHEGIFICAKVKAAPSINNHFLVTQDEDEITVITKKENALDLDIIEISSTDRTLLEIKFTISLDVYGFLAAVSAALAEQEISISVISTYSKDYILIPEEAKEKALEALTNLGFTIKE